jgi:predicted dehydrogenase
MEPRIGFLDLMKRIIRTLLVGVGNRGRWPLEHCRPEFGWEVVGLVDRDPAFLEAARQQTGLPPTACFAEVEPALESVRPEAAILCTPTVTHAPFAKLALDRGVAVLTEKGMAPTWEDARDLVSYAAERDGIFAVAQNYRYDGLSTLVSEVLQRGAGAAPRLENVFLVDYVQHRVRPVPNTLTYPFASIWDMSCHHFDNLLCWLGPVEEIEARSYRAPYSPYQHDPNTSAFLRFASGVWVNYTHTHDASRSSLRIEMHGSNGALVVRGNRAEFSERPSVNFGECPVTELPIPQLVSEARLLADFHAYVAERKEPGISGRHNLEVMAMCEMTVRSIKQGRPVRRSEL